MQKVQRNRVYLKIIDVQRSKWRKNGWQVSDDAVYLLGQGGNLGRAADFGVRGRQLAMLAPRTVAIKVLEHGAQLACKRPLRRLATSLGLAREVFLQFLSHLLLQSTLAMCL